MRRRLLLGTLGALAALVALPGGAWAASVDNSDDILSFFAAAGETNNVTFTASGTDIVVDDPGVPITPMATCVAIDVDTVSCPAAATETLNAYLGDMGDMATVDGSIAGLEGSNFYRDPVRLIGGAGNDTLNGSPTLMNVLFGHDDFGAGPGDDTLTGGAAGDFLAGSEGNDELSGGDGSDQIIPGEGNDTILGGPGNNDSIIFGSSPDGADDTSGGDGEFDQVYYGGRSGDLTISTNDVADDGEAGEGDNVRSDVESISGGNGNDTITTGPEDDFVYGGEGNDDIATGSGGDQGFGGGGNDTIDTGDGDDSAGGNNGVDSVSTGDGADTISEASFDDEADTHSGGPGIDLLDRSQADAPLTISLDGVADDGEPGEGDNSMPDIENVISGVRDDLIEGTNADNHIVGGPGADTLIGGGGADGLIGGSAQYTGGGGGGSEVIDGGDTLIGGRGIDTFSGGTGADVVRSRDNGADEIRCGSSVDTVFADSRDEPHAACDRVSRGVQILSRSARAEDGKVAVKASCPALEAGPCKTSFKIVTAAKIEAAKKKRVVVARGNKTIKAGKRVSAKLKLTKDGQRLLSGRRSLAAVVSAKMTDSNGDKVTTSRKLSLSG